MVTHLRRALEIGPPETVLDALVELARSAEAALVLRRAIGLDPFKFRATKKSDVRVIEPKEYASAWTALESYVERFPAGSFM